MSAPKKKANKRSVIVRSSKANELMTTYHNLGFVPSGKRNEATASDNNWLAPVSFLPHVDYTISSVVGGY